MMWLNDVYSLVAKEQNDEAIDILFEKIDDLLCENKMEECDIMLRSIDLKRLNVSLLVALLSITASVSTILKERTALIERIEVILKDLVPQRCERLMQGLK